MNSFIAGYMNKQAGMDPEYAARIADAWIRNGIMKQEITQPGMLRDQIMSGRRVPPYILDQAGSQYTPTAKQLAPYEATPEQIKSVMDRTKGMREQLYGKGAPAVPETMPTLTEPGRPGVPTDGTRRLIQALMETEKQPSLMTRAMQGVGRVMAPVARGASRLMMPVAAATAGYDAYRLGKQTGTDIGNATTPLSGGMSPESYKRLQGERAAVRQNVVQQGNSFK